MRPSVLLGFIFCVVLFAQALKADEGLVSLDFQDADIHNVLKVLSFKSGVNIVISPEVAGNVTIQLKDVPWQKALEVILSTYGYGYDRREFEKTPRGQSDAARAGGFGDQDLYLRFRQGFRYR